MTFKSLYQCIVQ